MTLSDYINDLADVSFELWIQLYTGYSLGKDRSEHEITDIKKEYDKFRIEQMDYNTFADKYGWHYVSLRQNGKMLFDEAEKLISLLEHDAEQSSFTPTNRTFDEWLDFWQNERLPELMKEKDGKEKSEYNFDRNAVIKRALEFYRDKIEQVPTVNDKESELSQIEKALEELSLATA